MIKNHLVVAEQFYSIQGEGISSGIPAVFIRLAACNLLCGGKGTDKDRQLHNGATWRCDTIEVWQKGTKMSFGDIAYEWVPRLRAGAHMVITGGEPMLQQRQIFDFLEWWFKEYGFHPFVEIETNGTIAPNVAMASRIDQWNCSPKLANSGEPLSKRLKPDVILYLASKAWTQFKFVVSREEDWDEIFDHFIAPGLINRDQIVLMPSASDMDELLNNNQMVADLCITANLRFSSRLQIEIWNKTVGV